MPCHRMKTYVTELKISELKVYPHNFSRTLNMYWTASTAFYINLSLIIQDLFVPIAICLSINKGLVLAVMENLYLNFRLQAGNHMSDAPQNKSAAVNKHEWEKASPEAFLRPFHLTSSCEPLAVWSYTIQTQLYPCCPECGWLYNTLSPGTSLVPYPILSS